MRANARQQSSRQFNCDHLRSAQAVPYAHQLFGHFAAALPDPQGPKGAIAGVAV